MTVNPIWIKPETLRNSPTNDATHGYPVPEGYTAVKSFRNAGRNENLKDIDGVNYALTANIADPPVLETDPFVIEQDLMNDRNRMLYHYYKLLRRINTLAGSYFKDFILYESDYGGNFVERRDYDATGIGTEITVYHEDENAAIAFHKFIQVGSIAVGAYACVGEITDWTTDKANNTSVLTLNNPIDVTNNGSSVAVVKETVELNFPVVHLNIKEDLANKRCSHSIDIPHECLESLKEYYSEGYLSDIVNSDSLAGIVSGEYCNMADQGANLELYTTKCKAFKCPAYARKYFTIAEDSQLSQFYMGQGLYFARDQDQPFPRNLLIGRKCLAGIYNLLGIGGDGHYCLDNSDGNVLHGKVYEPVLLGAMRRQYPVNTETHFYAMKNWEDGDLLIDTMEKHRRLSGATPVTGSGREAPSMLCFETENLNQHSYKHKVYVSDQKLKSRITGDNLVWNIYQFCRGNGSTGLKTFAQKSMTATVHSNSYNDTSLSVQFELGEEQYIWNDNGYNEEGVYDTCGNVVTLPLEKRNRSRVGLNARLGDENYGLEKDMAADFVLDNVVYRLVCITATPGGGDENATAQDIPSKAVGIPDALRAIHKHYDIAYFDLTTPDGVALHTALAAKGANALAGSTVAIGCGPVAKATGNAFFYTSELSGDPVDITANVVFDYVTGKAIIPKTAIATDDPFRLKFTGEVWDCRKTYPAEDMMIVENNLNTLLDACYYETPNDVTPNAVWLQLDWNIEEADPPVPNYMGLTDGIGYQNNEPMTSFTNAEFNANVESLLTIYTDPTFQVYETDPEFLYSVIGVDHTWSGYFPQFNVNFEMRMQGIEMAAPDFLQPDEVEAAMTELIFADAKVHWRSHTVRMDDSDPPEPVWEQGSGNTDPTTTNIRIGLYEVYKEPDEYPTAKVVVDAEDIPLQVTMVDGDAYINADTTAVIKYLCEHYYNKGEFIKFVLAPVGIEKTSGITASEIKKMTKEWYGWSMTFDAPFVLPDSRAGDPFDYYPNQGARCTNMDFYCHNFVYSGLTAGKTWIKLNRSALEDYVFDPILAVDRSDNKLNYLIDVE